MSQPATINTVPSFAAPYAVIDDFLPAELAQAMRRDIVGHFSDPQGHEAATHQVWNYWHVPNLYTYLRTNPEKVIQAANVTLFHDRLKAWSGGALGMSQATWPYLSLYIDGCRQELHNDAANGRFGFVYSLTAPERRTVGGETILLREGDAFRRNMQNPRAGRGLYDLVEARFNRLVVFDDRLVHGVERVEGPMDPLDGRIVLHGHLSEGGPLVAGALSFAQLIEPLRTAFNGFAAERSATINLYQGVLTVRFEIEAAGRVASIGVILDRVIYPTEGDTTWEGMRDMLVRRLAALRFPPASGPTTVIMPMAFGSPLRGMAKAAD